MRNSIMLISHNEHLVSVEGGEWGYRTAIDGTSGRLVPILMTALASERRDDHLRIILLILPGGCGTAGAFVLAKHKGLEA